MGNFTFTNIHDLNIYVAIENQTAGCDVELNHQEIVDEIARKL